MKTPRHWENLITALVAFRPIYWHTYLHLLHVIIKSPIRCLNIYVSPCSLTFAKLQIYCVLALSVQDSSTVLPSSPQKKTTKKQPKLKCNASDQFASRVLCLDPPTSHDIYQPFNINFIVKF